MADQQHGNTALAPQFLQQVQDLRFYRDVERCGRLIQQQQFRLTSQRGRDHRALFHATGKLVRVGAGDLGRARDAHLAQQGHSASKCRLAREALVLNQRLGYLEADGE